jgi:hypothetical protein
MTCEHFAREGLARQEAGKPDPHVDGCADCQAARATYRRMTDALADVGADLRPRDGWEDEVLAKVRAPAPVRRWWIGAGLGGALLAAAIALVLMRGRRPPERVASIERVASGSAVRGGDLWTSGDSIWSISEGGGAVWIYRGDALLRTCDAASIDPPRCVRHGRGVRAWVPTRVGTYHVFAFQSPPPPVAPATYDEAKAIVSRRARWATDQSFDVR